MTETTLTIALEEINPFELPALPLESRKNFPTCPACYFAISGNKIFYIGKASNLLKRWAGHHRYAELEQHTDVKIAWIEFNDPSLLPIVETALIQHFKPLLNQRKVRICKPRTRGRLGNPQAFLKICENMAELPLAVRVPAHIDKYVRSLPNRAEWLREAIEDKWRKETQ